MSSTDFRQIALGNDEGKPERLFRAAVSAFCSLTRPSRQEIVQLEELALSLYNQVSAESRRFVAAALSESAHAPAGLVRRLAHEDIEIAAPLLLRSKALPDATLVSLIARRGLPHARAIAHRPALDPAIAALIRVLESTAPAEAEPPAGDIVKASTGVSLTVPAPQERSRPKRSRVVRDRLRAMMADAGAGSPGDAGDPVQALPQARYETLRETALSGALGLFQTALADALDVRFSDAGLLLQPGSRDRLTRVLAGLGLSLEQAFLLVAAIDPAARLDLDAIRGFVDAFMATDVESGREEIRAMRAARLSALTTRLGERRVVRSP